MSDHTDSTSSMSFETAHGLARNAFEGLEEHVYDFVLTHQPDTDRYAIQAVLQGSEADQALRAATETLSSIPRGHLTMIGKLAVTQSDPEAMHDYDSHMRREAVMIRDLTLSVLSPGERFKLLGQ